MIHEILLALTGLPSALIVAEADSAFHPSEQKLLFQVHEFSQVVRSVQHRISENPAQIARSEATPFLTAVLMIQPAVKNVLDAMVVGPYLQEIADIEQTILARNPKLISANNNVALSTLIAVTVQSWVRRFGYALSVLEYLDQCAAPSSRSERPVNVFSIFQESVGFKAVEAIRQACVDAMVKVWLQVLSSWVLYGHDADLARDFFGSQPQVFQPLNLPESTGQLIYSTGGLIHQLSKEGTNSRVNFTAKLELLRESYLEEINSLSVPVHSFQVTRLITGIRQGIILRTGSQHFSAKLLSQFFQVLRSVVLFGDPLFAEEFAKEIPKSLEAGNVVLFPESKPTNTGSHRMQRKVPLQQAVADAFQRTLRSITEDAKCSDQQKAMFSLAQTMLSLNKKTHRDGGHTKFLETLTGLPLELAMTLTGVQGTILQTSRDKSRYVDMFSLLAGIKICMALLTSLWTPEYLRKSKNIDLWAAYAAKLFLDVLWEFFESFVIDAQFKPLFESLQNHEKTQLAVNPDEVSQMHSTILDGVYDMLRLGNEVFVKLMGELMLEIKILHSACAAGTAGAGTKVTARMREIYKCIEEIQLSETTTSKAGLHILLLRLEFLNIDQTSPQ